MNVEKRTGQIVEFDQNKISKAILAANRSVEAENKISKEDAELIAAQIKDDLESESNETISIDNIQDSVERALQKAGYYELAKQYIIYRREEDKERFKRTKLAKEILSKLNAAEVVNQNANVDERSFGGRKGEANSVMMKQLALDYYISPKFVKNHKENRVYIHDLDNYVVGCHNCLSIPFDDLLANGFTTRQADIRPANSIASACQLIAVIFQLQSLQQFGGVSATHMDWTLVPYFRKSFNKHFKEGLTYVDRKVKFIKDYDDATLSVEDKKYKRFKNSWKYAMDLTKKEAFQALEGMFHNLNTLQSRSGNQLPFTSINFGTCTLLEGQIISEAILNASIEGIGPHHLTSIFPCAIFQYKKGINDEEGTPNYYLKQLAIKSLSTRLYPNFANCDWSNQVKQVAHDRSIKRAVIANLDVDVRSQLIAHLEKQPFNKDMELLLEYKNGYINVIEDELPEEQFSTMGCRTANGSDINYTEQYYLAALIQKISTGKLLPGTLKSAAQKDGRGNIAPATVILPTLAMEATKKAKGNAEEVINIFFNLLEKAIEDTRDELAERLKWIEAQSEQSATFMYQNNSMFGYNQSKGIASAIRHGTLAIGKIGVAECLQILIGKNHLTDEGMELAKRIDTCFNTLCEKYKHETSLNYGVYNTPAENLCFTAMKAFKKKYGVIPNVSDRDYFTNSIHVPVWEKVTPFEKIDTECQLVSYSNAGCITYVEVDDVARHNLKGLEQIIDYAMAHDIPYFAINVPADGCNNCGHQGLIDETCDVCGSTDIRHLRRVTGYLTGDYKTAFNQGKIAEVEDRIAHTSVESRQAL